MNVHVTSHSFLFKNKTGATKTEGLAERQKWLKIFVQKIAKNWTFFDIFWPKSLKTGGFEHFRPKIWDIHGTYVAEYFLHKNCKKLHFFWTFLGKSAEKRLFWAIWVHFTAHLWEIYGSPKMCKKLAKNWTFFEKIAENLGNKRFSAKNWQIYGTYVRPSLCKKLHFFS